MSKLSEPLKQFINAAHARPNTIPAPKGVSGVYERIAREAGERKVGVKAWLCASVSCLRMWGVCSMWRYVGGVVGSGTVANVLP